ncbi:MAG: sigma 54-interacting transcriptional regulator, partial [Bacteroidia bacterium]
RAILSKHNINLLGLRGQAKTRLARLMVRLLDEWMPIVEGSEVNDDPMQPLSRFSRDLIAEKGDATPIAWVHRNERFVEKLATPDVSVADLIGDVDPIKAANLKLPYSDERTIHFGLIPRANRCIFVINELPDLQARIQVALFNILQEGDIQIRGFQLRLPLDVQFVFTANPEDYTNRGSIVTPLKDRIGSQILTHYPKSIELAKAITLQEAKSGRLVKVLVPDAALSILEQIGFEARESEYVDAKSGVSARLSISAYENLLSAAERRALMNHETETMIRLTDFAAIVPSITGKIEMVYEGEQEGAAGVARHLIGKAIRSLFTTYFPSPEKLKKKTDESPYQAIIDWFGEGHTLDLMCDITDRKYAAALAVVDGLDELTTKLYPQIKGTERLFLMEFILHGLAEFSRLNKNTMEQGAQFGDLFTSMLTE